MPAKSKAQFRFMKAVESGAVKAPGLSRAEAAEYTAGQSPSKLPERKSLRDLASNRKGTKK